MNKSGIIKNNKGASLVLVIVAMLFVGIIASIILTVTVGNSRTTRATISNSESFYTSESALDDLKMFFKKLATSAATKAYGKTLETLDPSTLEADFKDNFKTAFKAELTEISNLYTTNEGTLTVLDADFIDNQISFSRAGTGEKIKICFSGTTIDNFLDISGTYPILKGIQVSFTDATGYESTITTDMTFKAALPSTSTGDTSEYFSYPIDNFIMISGENISPANGTLSGKFTGNIYAEGNFNIWTKSPALNPGVATKADKLYLNIQKLIVGNNINVKGRMYLWPIDNTDIIGVPTQSEVWCNNLKLSGSDSSVGMNVQEPSSDQDTAFETKNTLASDVYLKGNLELNGVAASYKAGSGSLFGFSSEPSADSVVRTKPDSSAIILNGLGAKLDLSGLNQLKIAGRAYTALPDINATNAIENLYAYYSGSGADPNNGYYYTQGESITYRALQALYLVPGDYIKGVGHNPMKKSEFESIATLDTSTNKYVIKQASLDIPSDIASLLGSQKVRYNIVRYLAGGTGSSDIVYLFFDFATDSDATKYFNKVTGTNGRYAELLDKQGDILGRNDGYIKLPSSGVQTSGNRISYTETNGTSKESGSEISLSGYAADFYGLKTTLDKSNTLSSAYLLENMFKDFYVKNAEGNVSKDANGKKIGNSSHVAARSDKNGSLQGPLKYVDKNGVTHIADPDSISPASAKNRKYYLITGDSISLSASTFASDTTYIIITPGDVRITGGGNFRGMIIAGGDIKIDDGLNMECMGMLTYDIDGQHYECTEFHALLYNVVTGDSAELATQDSNTRLRTIFNVADNSTEAGGSKDGEFVTIESNEWKVN